MWVSSVLQIFPGLDIRKAKEKRQAVTKESIMASQPGTAPKRTVQTKSKTKTARPARKNGSAATSKSKKASPTRRKPLREMTLEELSLRAYKMTYEQLHGSKKKKK